MAKKNRDMMRMEHTTRTSAVMLEYGGVAIAYFTPASVKRKYMKGARRCPNMKLAPEVITDVRSAFDTAFVPEKLRMLAFSQTGRILVPPFGRKSQLQQAIIESMVEGTDLLKVLRALKPETKMALKESARTAIGIARLISESS